MHQSTVERNIVFSSVRWERISRDIEMVFLYRDCFVCQTNLQGSSKTISSADRYYVFLKKNVWIPEGARFCSDHVVDRQLTANAVDRMAPSSVQLREFSVDDVQLLISNWQTFFQGQRRLNFDDTRSLSDHEVKVLTSLSKTQSDDLIHCLSYSTFRQTNNRSIRTAVGMLLCKLRLGLPNELLALLFEQSDKRAVARSLESARKVLMDDFVSKNLGSRHVRRDEIIQHRTSSIARKLMCNDDSDTAIVVVDGTYLYIQVRK